MYLGSRVIKGVFVVRFFTLMVKIKPNLKLPVSSIILEQGLWEHQYEGGWAVMSCQC